MDFTAKSPAAELLKQLTFLNNFFPHFGAMLLLGALACLTIRKDEARLQAHALLYRLRTIQIALFLGSSILVVAVVSTKLLLQWPLSLLIDAQRDALTVLADALLLRWGTLSTLTLIAAFTPVMLAWSLDAAEVRARTGDRQSAGIEGLDLTLLPKIGGIIAILAPLLASPFVDALKAVLDSVR
jgi:hypothetical protein